MALNGLKLSKSNPINLFFIVLIKFYQLFLSNFFSGNCRFVPSCSEYSIESFKNFGPITALKMTILRLLRCHPFGKSGYDPIIKDNPKFILKIIPLKQMQVLREKYLYSKKKKKLAIYLEDDENSTRHFILYFNDNIVSGLTLIKKIENKKHHYQIRGMFTLPKYRSLGFGTKLLANVESEIVNRKYVIWCNARYKALDFYKKNGFKTNGNFFLIKGVGKHLRMEKNEK